VFGVQEELSHHSRLLSRDSDSSLSLFVAESQNGGGPSFPYAMHHQAEMAGVHGIPHHPHVMMDPKHTEGGPGDH